VPKLNNVQDLDRICQETQQALKARLDTSTTIAIGMGTCGLAAGANETRRAILEELARRQITANVTSVGCIGMCVREPLVDIQQAGQPRITYANVKPDMVPRLIEEHLVQGRPVAEWVLGRLET
jgi:NADP-reducing hydrogenase subunit HndB